MKIVLLAHPGFLQSQSMPRFATMLAAAFRSRGHDVETWAPATKVFGPFAQNRFAKWAGYVDQYLVFPQWLRQRLKRQEAGTLYVFCDQALGPWVPWVKRLPHVVHCHDLLALRSALGDIPENPTSFTGKIYQRYIRWGFRQARHFISVSEKSRTDLHRFGGVQPVTSEVVYNGLNHPFESVPQARAVQTLTTAGLAANERGMLLHVGGGQWYKNTVGVVALYAQYASQRPDPLPLWMVSPAPNDTVALALKAVPPQGKVLFFKGLDNDALQCAYSLARALIFPSLAEGFGWPIAEAMACGCPVLTTGEPPMQEVGGSAARYVPRLQPGQGVQAWAAAAAPALEELLSLSDADRQVLAKSGQLQAARFNTEAAIDAYLRIYGEVLAKEASRRGAQGAGLRVTASSAE